MHNEAERPAKHPLAVLKELVVGLFIALLASYLILTYLILNTYSPTGSMSPTLAPGYHAIANRLAYMNSIPARGEIIVFTRDDEQGTLYVKRIIGLPGETIEITGSTTYVNGQALNEPYIANRMEGSWGPYVIPNRYYFVMGDNRNQSEDSRHWENRFVHEDDILGGVVFSYYPEFKLIPDVEY